MRKYYTIFDMEKKRMGFVDENIIQIKQKSLKKLDGSKYLEPSMLFGQESVETSDAGAIFGTILGILAIFGIALLCFKGRSFIKEALLKCWKREEEIGNKLPDDSIEQP